MKASEIAALKWKNELQRVASQENILEWTEFATNISRKLSFSYVHSIELSFMNELLVYSFIVGSLLNKGLCPVLKM